jgi:molecular chaperone GrpE (heat shock protein)
MVEETDEEFKTRQKIMEAEEQFDKDRRRMTYERLKAEFENEK